MTNEALLNNLSIALKYAEKMPFQKIDMFVNKLGWNLVNETAYKRISLSKEINEYPEYVFDIHKTVNENLNYQIIDRLYVNIDKGVLCLFSDRIHDDILLERSSTKAFRRINRKRLFVILELFILDIVVVNLYNKNDSFDTDDLLTRMDKIGLADSKEIFIAWEYANLGLLSEGRYLMIYDMTVGTITDKPTKRDCASHYKSNDILF